MNRILYLNVSAVSVPFGGPKPWMFELHSSDGTTWTIERHDRRDECIERAEEFAQFSGLPLYVQGEPWIVEGMPEPPILEDDE